MIKRLPVRCLGSGRSNGGRSNTSGRSVAPVIYWLRSWLAGWLAGQLTRRQSDTVTDSAARRPGIRGLFLPPAYPTGRATSEDAATARHRQKPSVSASEQRQQTAWPPAGWLVGRWGVNTWVRSRASVRGERRKAFVWWSDERTDEFSSEQTHESDCQI